MSGEVAVANTQLGQYLVLKHLATGGMAEVLLARDLASGAHVVIKRIRRDQAEDPQFVKMFLEEAQLASALEHEHVVRVFDIGQQDGEFFFAMEYVHGEDLRQVLMQVHRSRDKVPIALITNIVAAAAAGLHHAHEARAHDGRPLGIVHRDVSPANILVGYDGVVKMADFGIAKAVLRSVETHTGTLKGKVSYMSPEQVTGKPLDRRSDVYALGIVLYEVATARRLFKGDNDFLTMSAIVQGEIPLPSQHRADLPRILEDIIMKALSVKPADRFQTTEEMRVELEKFTHAIGMRMSASSVADYMKKLFGLRAEPWLADREVTITGTVDFDGSASGLVRPPEPAVVRHELPRSMPTSLIAHAHALGVAAPVAPPPANEDWSASSAGSAGPLAWPTQPTALKPRRRVGVVLGAVAGAAALVVFLAVRKPSPHGDDAPAAATPAIEMAPTATTAHDRAAARAEEPVATDDTDLASSATTDDAPAPTEVQVDEPVSTTDPVETEPVEPVATTPVATTPVASTPVATKPVATKPVATKARPAARPKLATKAKPATKPKLATKAKPATKPAAKKPTTSTQWNPDELFPE